MHILEKYPIVSKRFHKEGESIMEKSISKKLATLLLGAGLILAACQDDGGATGEGAATYKGVGQGRNGEIVTEVTVENGQITNIEVIESSETENLAEPVYTNLGDEIVASNSTDVDVVTGSTETSEGYLEAINDALESNNVVLEKSTSKETTQAEMDEEYTYDVVVIGAGGAGYSAAIEAANQGYSVTILEKLPVTGGNTLISGGEMNAPGNWVQENLGIEGDNPEVFYEDTMVGGDHLGDPDMVRIMADQALESAEWLRDEIEVEFIEDQLFQFGGHTYQRALIPIGHTGQEVINKLDAKAKELGIDIYTETPAVELMTDDNNTVVGVLATHDEQEITFKANEGVIITTGGFGANIEMRMEVNEEFDERYGTTNSPGAQGDGIVMAQAIGAAIENMESVQTYPVSNPKTGEISLLADTRFDGAALINQEGKRFVEELERRDVISTGILEQTGSYAFQVWDQKLAEDTGTLEAHQGELQRLLNDDLIYVADTLEEGAEYWDIPVDQFMETVAYINEAAETGEDPKFNHRSGLAPLEVGPFYFQKATPSVHHTMGGLVINENTEVLDEDGNPIENLYAAGEVTGVIQGSNRLGGNAITDIITFGRIAGQRIGN